MLVPQVGWQFSVKLKCFHPFFTALSYTSLESDVSATTALLKEIFTGYLMIFRQVKQ
jgi:hypothetical protein